MEAAHLTSPDARRVLEHLAPLPEPSPRPALVVLSGLPGVGKSYFARRLKAKAPVAVVETDAIRKVLVARPQYTDTEHAWVFRVAYAALTELLNQKISAVFDATNLQEGLRRKAYKIGRDAGARIVIVEVVAPPAVVQQRFEVRARGRKGRDRSDATWEVYQRMAPTAEPIRRPHYVADTGGDTTEVLMAVVAELRGEAASLSEPGLEGEPFVAG